MILSNRSLHEALDRGWIVIEPQSKPRRRSKKTAYCPYQTTSVDLALGTEISHFKRGLALPLTVDLRQGSFMDLFRPFSETKVISEDQPYALHPNQLVLARTRETISLPLIKDAPCLAARVEGKSSYARCGLLVHFTAPTIHAGFQGTITLELINLGPATISLFPGMPICQLIVEQVHGIPYPNPSQFQGQSRPGGKE